VAFLVAGAALVVDAVATGHASLALLLIIPVITGGSLGFLLGVLGLFLGILTLPFVFADEEDEPGPESSPSASTSGGSPAPSHEGGGVVLIGPIPLFFGSWGRRAARHYWWWVALGAALLVVALVAAAWLLG
jgi:uncharacterized membrane protein